MCDCGCHVMYLQHSACHKVFIQRRFIDFITVTICSIFNVERGGHLRKHVAHLHKFVEGAGVEKL